MMRAMMAGAIIMLVTAPALADELEATYECTRFKSKCIGTACDKIYAGLKLDVQRSILTMRPTQLVEYRITPQRALETIKTALAEDKDRDQKLVIEYLSVQQSGGEIVLANHDDKNNIREKVTINLASGLYAFQLLHTDGSIKDVPVGEPYTAYFGWCDNKSAPGAALTDSAAQAESSPAPLPSPPATNNASKP
jgi:hypothetical protein